MTTTARQAHQAHQARHAVGPRHLETELFSPRTDPAGGRLEAPTFDGVDDLLADSRSRLARVSARAAYQEVLFGRAVLVDIRPQAQREREGEVHPDLSPVVIERNVLEWRLDPRHPASLPIADLGLRVIVLCQEGYTSSLAADALLRIGIHRSTDVIDGFAAWRGAGLPQREPRVSGPTRSGPTRSGPTRSGPTRSGPTRSGPTRSGPTRSGPAREREARGSVPLPVDAIHQIVASPGR